MKTITFRQITGREPTPLPILNRLRDYLAEKVVLNPLKKCIFDNSGWVENRVNRPFSDRAV
jgi:hypothetical protein